MTNMTDVENKLMNRIVVMLQASGAQYKIIDKDGNEFGALEVQPKKKKIFKHKEEGRQIGDLCKYFVPFVSNMQVGDVVVIPPSTFNVETLRGSLCSWAFKTWGKGNSVTHIANGQIEIMRLL